MCLSPFLVSLSSSVPNQTGVSGMCTLPKKKAPAPPPPEMGHSRNISDPFPPRKGHVRSPSDPPPLPAKPVIIRNNPMPGKC